MMPGIDYNEILETVDYLITNQISEDIHPDYNVNNFSDRILNIITSYINYVKEKSLYNLIK